MTTKQLCSLIFPCTDDENAANRAHFIRRFHENSNRLARIVGHDFKLSTLGETAEEFFHLQAIRTEGYDYGVLWFKPEWQESVEKRMEVRDSSLSWQLDDLARRAKELRVEKVKLALAEICVGKTKAYIHEAAVKLTESPSYVQKARDLEELFFGIQNNRIYFSLEELMPLVDERGVLARIAKGQQVS